MAPGQVLCLLGPNGGDKTTLFKTMLGLLSSQVGEVRLDGPPLASLVMNEPTASLDFGKKVIVLDQIRQLTKTGLSTHDADHAFACSDRVAILAGCKITA